MKRTASILCHVAVLLAAARYSHSASGFLVTGLGLALLLDRYATRLLPWAAPAAWPKELSVRAGYAAAGAVAAYLARPGVVPVREVALLGAGFSLIAFLLELLVGLAARVTGRRSWLRLVALGVVALLSPLAALHPIHTVPKRTPAALGLAFEEVHFGSGDGVRLAGWLVPHPQARANVVFCHGHGRNRGQVAGLLPTLHRLRLNVLAFERLSGKVSSD
jgi:hypothetical protein